MVHLSTTETDAGLSVTLRGVIDESFGLEDLAGRYISCVVFDLAEVERITSYGVREWQRALDSIRADYIAFVRCSPSCVAQFNLVANFGGRGELLSFYAPYRCTRCAEEQQELIDLLKDHQRLASGELGPVECRKCGAPSEFDDVEEMFFDYAATAPPPRPPARVHSLLNGHVPKRRKFRAKKTVRGDVTILRLQGPMDRSAYFKRLVEGMQGDVVVNLSEITGVSEDGLLGLRRLLSEPGVTAYLVEVPTSILEPLSASLGAEANRRALVISISIVLHCPACEFRGSSRLRDEKLEQLEHGGPLACPQCGAEQSLPGMEAVRRALSRLPTGRAPASIASLGVAGEVSRSQLLLGKYEIQKRIGRGGMGEVYLARHIGPASFEKEVVLKRIRPDHRHRNRAVEEFLAEARIAAQLNHRNIVQIFDFELLDDEYIIAMEHVDGIELGEALRLSRAAKLEWPIALCCRIISDLCAGLHAAHTHVGLDGRPYPIIHRDVSPPNVLLAADGTVKLTDFGIAKHVGSSRETDPGVFKGKPAYAAPEQIFAAAAPNPRIDIYAAGAVLFECLTSVRYALASKGRRSAAGETLAELRPDAPPGLLEIVTRAMEFNPLKRHSSCQEMRSELEQILSRHQAGTDDLAAWIARVTALDAVAPIASDATLTVSDRSDEPTTTTQVSPLAGTNGFKGR